MNGSNMLTTNRIHICSPINWVGVSVTIGVVVVLMKVRKLEG